MAKKNKSKFKNIGKSFGIRKLIRKNPTAAMAIAAGLGVLVQRFGKVPNAVGSLISRFSPKTGDKVNEDIFPRKAA